ncbi:MAG: hypothetical protein EAZ64_08890 [Sphingobacteriales bacterium]|nr:MAG: hypothetical protein EAZ64_08890 [Sphingobacteriales bacterium]
MVNQIHYLSKAEAELLLKNTPLPKQKTLILLMLDAGLRVTEAISLRLNSFDFKNRILTVNSLKKKSTQLRQIPISNRLYQAIADYISTIKKLEPTNFLFPSILSLSGHISRKAAWKMLNRKAVKLNLPNLHPHALRHTFATHHLSAGSQLEEIKNMLGHSSLDTTLIYAAIPTQQLINRVNAVSGVKLSIYQRLRNWFNPVRRTIINLDFSQNNFSVGRNPELNQLNNNAQKGINTIIIAPIGLGKSHLLKNITTDKKILNLDDTENFKASLANILLLLFKDRNSVLDIIWKDFDITQVKNKVQKETTLNMCEIIISAVKAKEYILIIDDISRITPSGRKILEKLKDTFIIFTAAREVKANETSFLWNFEILKLQPLNRSESIKLIHALSNNLEVENLELFRNHIYEQTNGIRFFVASNRFASFPAVYFTLRG